MTVFTIRQSGYDSEGTVLVSCITPQNVALILEQAEGGIKMIN